MAGLWKRDGTVAVTSGSKKVTGTGTTFADAKNGVAKGHLFCMTTGATVDLYEVDYVVSNTELFLVQAFRGVTGTGKAYEVITTFSDSIPEFARKLNASLSYYQGQSDMVQQLFTSDAAEITVTAPDGTTHKLVPWKRVTSDGEGQAARAKVEADRSKTEADRAVTEADRAAGIVAAAALPLPDVWAPLSDSLRLITGYGRDVMIGSDVVARMVNFSRNSTATYIGKDGQLKTAAANEPRFEREGLLIEGQSTNILTKSSGLGYWSGATADEIVESLERDPFGVTGEVISVVSKAPTNLYKAITVQPATTYTFSIFYKVKATAASCSVKWGFEGTGIEGGSARVEIDCLTGSLIFSDAGILRWKSTKLADGWNRFDVSAKTSSSTTTVTLNISEGAQNIANSLMIFGWQLEALPFASSYIPTTGAAATRAADIVTIPWAMNINPATVTVALNYDVLGVVQASQRIIEYAAPAVPRYIMQVTLTGNFESYCGTSPLVVGTPPIGPGSLAVASTSPTRHALRLTGKNIAAATPSGPANATSNVTIGAGAAGSVPLYGHVRNLRIWHRAFTDDQLKAVV
ncbi:hypothetical protein E4630_16150 [Aeromonas hydrophila]|uniref:phage head spike fiber domain-containing protein n=1 Tax=Aeromonas hydrophila TaxID=644 RepID=UPI00107E6F2B|nr:hypothetical protein [Aeromonas hydrophila]QBX71424.1 hypothetical protein E4625_11650 [Aeromonas hydrophila]QBX72253.1 hypothetical protein E4625_16375 [Aeromonas hydrophila]QBX76123.1 hypothetical protein E4630_11430 [Aeromonas hydrophila]QBX76953.1 hypothetical protein E4630_16150 [Aeromonas hydrophila]